MIGDTEKVGGSGSGGGGGGGGQNYIWNVFFRIDSIGKESANAIDYAQN